MASDWRIGDKLENRLEIHKILRGGMGIVYIVYDHDWHEAYAAKTFQEEVFARDPAIADRFMQEALVWVKLDIHQNTTHARFVQGIGDRPFIFLEFINGGDLADWIGKTYLTADLAQVMRFAIQFCDGMIHARSKGIIAHRDIKPTNCLITENQTLKITDFGLAKAIDDMKMEVGIRFHPENLCIGYTRTGRASGTCTHMAPEKFDNAKHVDVRADIYSFGVMLFQMITGKLPFNGKSWIEFERLHKTEIPPLEDINYDPLSSVIDTCLAKSPVNRFADFKAIREVLAGIYKEKTGETAPEPDRGTRLAAGQWKTKGWSLRNLGRVPESLECYNRAIELDSNDNEAWYNKGNALHDLGRPAQALACYDRAIEINPQDADIWNNKGSSLRNLDRCQEAIVCYDQAIKINPDFEKVWNNKGNALADIGRYEDAIYCFDRAIKININYGSA